MATGVSEIVDAATRFEGSFSMLTSRQPFGNQPDDSPVANPMLDETDQPFPVDLVEKGLNLNPGAGGLRRFGKSLIS